MYIPYHISTYTLVVNLIVCAGIIALREQGIHVFLQIQRAMVKVVASMIAYNREEGFEFGREWRKEEKQT